MSTEQSNLSTDLRLNPSNIRFKLHKSSGDKKRFRSLLCSKLLEFLVKDAKNFCCFIFVINEILSSFREIREVGPQNEKSAFLGEEKYSEACQVLMLNLLEKAQKVSIYFQKSC